MAKVIKSSPKPKLAAIRKAMKASLIERDDEVDITLTALIAQENPLLVGPPGTAKSMLLDTLMKFMDEDVRSFVVLFNKFTTPEEVFGPISVRGLTEDIYRRVTKGKLPEAMFGFGDEIFKASTAILNTLLRILNERVYENGDGSFRKCPLKLFVAASNEFADANELGALFDRFLLRKKVKPIMSPANRRRLLFGSPDHSPTVEDRYRLSTEDINQAKEEAESMIWDDRAEEAMLVITHTLNKNGIFPGDRRMFKSVKVCQAYAYLNGKSIVETEDLEILAHTLWDDPTEQPEVCAKIVMKLANPTGGIITEKKLMIADVVAKSSPSEAVPKLQGIQSELKALPSHPQKEDALEYVESQIKLSYDAVLGIRN